jgi:hypothetical protein
MLLVFPWQPGGREVEEMISPVHFWFGSFAGFLAAFLLILWKEGEIRYLFYAVFGSLTAFFMFDVPSSALGFYVYRSEYYFFSILGIPLTMTLAEGLCIAITIYAYEKLQLLPRMLKK